LRIIASSFELVDPLCDESHFDKNVGAGLRALASGPAGRGLFTSETQDPNWRKAHNVLLPSFSMDAMRGYYPRMLDIATQLMLKWERRGEVQPPQRHAKQEPQTGHDAIAIANAHARLGKMKLESADILRRGRIGGLFEKRSEPPAAVNVAPLRSCTELACVHVLDHALAQRADRNRAHRQLLS